ncbi:ABC transporter substrate-binding protein [Gordonia hydrophobica]|uniref:ABC transporter substrate-binding protein n=1 Tax=Gordonia hydrophobica TaxID=40516 RepID=A0ABZ2U8L9_9ACTN|nr:ABC transporter substrate-binding protein [Gordonia hydrophobica]MBM7365591.1 ABC-type nitrate/sulfonate/bicarbonate transport system substrate-binding protein [Gordonia hydrophobica]
MSRTTRWRRSLAALTVAVGTALAVVACGGGEQQAADGQGDTLKVGLARGVPADLMTYVADQEGFFTERGLNVDLVTMDNANSLATALIAGDLDVDTMVPALMWPALDKGACVKAMGSTIGNSLELVAQPDLAVTGDPTDPTTTLASLKGKTIGVIARGSGTELWTSALLEQAGLDPAKDVTFVAVGVPATAVQAFKAKQVDAMYYGPTMEEQLPPSEVTRVTDIVGRSGNALSPLVQAYYTGSCQALENRPKDMGNYCRAIWDAYSFSQDAKNNEVMGKHLGDLIGASPAAGAQSWAKLKSAYLAPTIEKSAWDAQAPLVASPAPTVPDFASSTYEPCAQGDPR